MLYPTGSFGILNNDIWDYELLALLDGGIEQRCDETYDFDNSRRGNYSGAVFQYTLSGKGCFERDGKVFELGEQMGFLVHIPDNSRYYLPKDAEASWKFIYLHFEGKLIEPFIEKLHSLGNTPFYLPITSAPVKKALQMQQKLMDNYQLMPYEGGEMLYSFLCALLRELNSPSEKKTNTLVQRAAKIMTDEYGTLESIDELASRLSVTPAHLSRIFKKETGALPVHFLTQCRLQASVHDLLNTEDMLDTIAERNGFSCSNYFCKVFKAHVGETPTQYRSHRKG